MPITFDSSSMGGNNSVTSLTISHTIAAAGLNRMLVVGLATHCSSAIYINSVTYNGVGMTYREYETAATGALLVQMWTMPEATLPAAGAYNIVASYDRTCDRGCMLFGTSYLNVAQVAPTTISSNTGDSITSLSNSVVPTYTENRIVQISATNLQQTPASSGTNNSSLNSGNNATLIGAGLFRCLPPQNVSSESFGVTVASSSSIATIFAQFNPVDAIAMLQDKVFENGFYRGFNRGSFRP
jgi:hypothetical protein